MTNNEIAYYKDIKSFLNKKAKTNKEIKMVILLYKYIHYCKSTLSVKPVSYTITPEIQVLIDKSVIKFFNTNTCVGILPHLLTDRNFNKFILVEEYFKGLTLEQVFNLDKDNVITKAIKQLITIQQQLKETP